jgi:kumamolisin
MADRKIFHDSVVSLPAQAGLTEGLLHHGEKPHDMDARLRLLFSLTGDEEVQAELEGKVAAGETVSPDELTTRYGPSQASVDALTEWLTKNGFEIEKVTADRAGVYASASLSAIEQALQVDMRAVTKEGMTYAAASGPPSLPANIAQDVEAIIGLQPYRQARKHLRYGPLPGREGVAGETASINRPNGYLVSDLLSAYDADGVAATGTGQTIAILIDTFPEDADTQAFWQANGLPEDLTRISKINVSGGTLPPISGEESLDTQWSSGIASGANVHVYATGGLDFVSLDAGIDRIIDDVSTTPSLRQMSMSLGLGELYFGSASAEIQTQHKKFLKLAALGVNVFVSSGDAGSNPDQTGHSATGPTQTEYESSDPAVIGVGGTTLRLDADGAVTSETAWSMSGGGKSVVFARPAWQTGDQVPAGTQRLVPDVACAADPATGGMVFINGTPQAVGGTSWAAPVWAAFCARINESRVSAGKAPLGFLGPLLYPVGASVAFRDITSGSNGAYSAGPGYDLATGLGSPVVAALIDALG